MLRVQEDQGLRHFRQNEDYFCIVTAAQEKERRDRGGGGPPPMASFALTNGPRLVACLPPPVSLPYPLEVRWAARSCDRKFDRFQIAFPWEFREEKVLKRKP